MCCLPYHSSHSHAPSYADFVLAPHGGSEPPAPAARLPPGLAGVKLKSKDDPAWTNVVALGRPRDPSWSAASRITCAP